MAEQLTQSKDVRNLRPVGVGRLADNSSFAAQHMDDRRCSSQAQALHLLEKMPGHGFAPDASGLASGQTESSMFRNFKETASPRSQPRRWFLAPASPLTDLSCLSQSSRASVLATQRHPQQSLASVKLGGSLRNGEQLSPFSERRCRLWASTLCSMFLKVTSS